MAMTIEAAKEHAKDGSDCMAEGERTIKKLIRSFPQLAQPLDIAVEHMKGARASIKVAQDSLETLANERK